MRETRGILKIDYDNGVIDFISDDETLVIKIVNLGELDRGVNGLIINHMVGIGEVKQLSDS